VSLVAERSNSLGVPRVGPWAPVHVGKATAAQENATRQDCGGRYWVHSSFAGALISGLEVV
jgi:hypothetical protein